MLNLKKVKKNNLPNEVLKTLAREIQASMKSLAQIHLQFPESNDTFQYPSLSMTFGDPEFTPENCPYQVSEDPDNLTPVDTQNPTTLPKNRTLYVDGYYEFPIQVDIWATSKKERLDLLQEFEKMFRKQFPIFGITAELKDYYNILCRYEYSGYNFADDGELTSQTKEWRVKIDVIAHCDSIHAVDESLMREFEVGDENINDDVSIIE